MEAKKQLAKLQKELKELLSDRPGYVDETIEALRTIGHDDAGIVDDLKNLKDAVQDPVSVEHPAFLSTFLDDFLAFRKGMALTPPFMAR